MLVSVAVITYNSSKTVIDTLKSILNQSYGSENIELIIADDASSDNTVKVIGEWLGVHITDFYNVVFIKNPTNLGVSGNINTAWKRASCNWVKSIAGDDLLDTKCIELNVNYVKENPDCKILFSKMQMFGRHNGTIPSPYNINFFYRNSEQQYNWLRSSGFNMAPSSFISTDLLNSVDYATEKYRMIEDLPLWIKITQAGHKLHFLDAITVHYRVDESISISKYKYINPELTQNLINIYTDHRNSFYKHPITEWLVLEKILNYKLMILISKINKNKQGKISRLTTPMLRTLKPMHSIKNLFISRYNRKH